jgi:hypothetical protein
VWYHGETDSEEYTQATKAVYKAAMINWMAQQRAMVGKTAAQLPFFLFGPPYWRWEGPCTIREVWAELAANSALNCYFVASQTSDTNWRDSSQSASGVVSGGSDGGHRNPASNLLLFKRIALVVARAIAVAQGASASAIPAALGTGYGPQVVKATMAGTVITCTVQHDAGTDLILPQLANTGIGWTLMDGGTIAAPGNTIAAVSAAYINQTSFSITMASEPTSAASACRLMYPYPFSAADIGLGNAITDNWGSVSKPAGWDINAAIDSSWGVNRPLQTPITVVGTGASAVATYGLALSSRS